MQLDELIRGREPLAEGLRRARALLQPPVPRELVWPVLAAAAFFALSALMFATAAILAPPSHVTPPAVEARGAY